MSLRSSSPLLSVVIPTHNRATLLSRSLESLVHQSLDRALFEVVVVDDGSEDDTADVCLKASRSLDLRHVFIQASGISAAKNLGIFVARAPLLFFFDDDDVASPELLARHVEAHRKYPAEHVAVLGYTTWAPGLTVTPVMHYVTDVGGFLFCYGPLHHGQQLDFTYFWGGRSSCKRSLLAQHGIFNQTFTFGSEDIELAFRLTRFAFQIVYDPNAVQYMNRAVTFDEFCARCERQGRSQAVFSRLHADRRVREHCEVVGAAERWAAVESRLAGAVARVHELEKMLEPSPRHQRQALIDELHSLYRFTFNGFKTKGIVETTGLSLTAA